MSSWDGLCKLPQQMAAKEKINFTLCIPNNTYVQIIRVALFFIKKYLNKKMQTIFFLGPHSSIYTKTLIYGRVRVTFITLMVCGGVCCQLVNAILNLIQLQISMLPITAIRMIRWDQSMDFNSNMVSVNTILQGTNVAALRHLTLF